MTEGFRPSGQIARHGQFFAVKVGRNVSGVGDDGFAIGEDLHGDAGCVRLAATAQAAVQCLENHVRLVAGFHNGADGADDQRYLHAGLQALAGYIAEQNQDSALPVRQNLEEVASDLLRRLVLGFKHITRNRGDRFGNEELLNLACLVDLRLPLLAKLKRLEEAPHQKDRDDIERYHHCDLADTHRQPEREEKQRYVQHQ